MWRLHQSLKQLGHESHALVGERLGTDKDCHAIPVSMLERVRGLVYRWRGFNDVYLTGTRRLVNHEWVKQADVIHLHNLHGGYFNYRALPELCRDRHVVWTLHDMWPLTGHCAYSFECARWRDGCGCCPHVDTYPAIERDTTSAVIHDRMRVFEALKNAARGVDIVSPSLWLHEIARDSVLRTFTHHHVPHGVDLSVYQPTSRDAARAALGLHAKARGLLCVASSFANPTKGMSDLISALHALPEHARQTLELWLVGLGASALAAASPVPTRDLGYNTGDAVKALIYSAADAVVVPSRAENFPLVVIEALACGCPVLGTSVGGIPDAVREGETGLLAQPDNPEALAAVIERWCTGQGLTVAMRDTCRAVATNEYDHQHMVARYTGIYDAGSCG